MMTKDRGGARFRHCLGSFPFSLRESYRDAGKVWKRTLANLPKWPPALVEGLRTLLQDLATVYQNTVAPRLPGAEPFAVVTRPAPLQQQAFKLLGVRLTCSQ